MASMSDRDKKIIYILLIAMVILLPYFFFIKDKRLETEAIKAENVSLQERLVYLQDLDSRRDEYIAKTEEMNKQRDDIIASFPADVKQENYTMFLLETEYSSVKADGDRTKWADWEYPLCFTTVTYGDNIETPISSEEADTGFTGISNDSVLSYKCYYDGIKYLLDYLMNYKDPMTYRNVTISFDTETGICTGTIGLSQYAVIGPDRVLPEVDIDPDLDENDLRGNEEVGIFGPVEVVSDEEEALTEAAAGEDTEENTEENAEENTDEE